MMSMSLKPYSSNSSNPISLYVEHDLLLPVDLEVRVMLRVCNYRVMTRLVSEGVARHAARYELRYKRLVLTGHLLCANKLLTQHCFVFALP